ncbi:MAG: hypothetical protein JNK38_14360 [Acidobacteria bacterium]|nr:hypothetical protein [Acidobacteriota bacterium]
MSNSNLDLNELASSQAVKISIATVENTAERESRLRVEEANAAHQRRKEMLLYSVTIGVVSIVVVLCAWVILRKGLATEDGKLALALLTSIVTGLVGYATGRASK